MNKSGCPNRAAFTLLEVMTVVMIVAILAVLAIPLYSKLRDRAQRAQCTANLRSLHVAVNLYTQQHNRWPPVRLTGDDEAAWQKYAEDWIRELEPFGVERKTWICPTIQNKEQNPDYTKNVRSDYMAMPFDDKPGTPHQWPNMPWFAERGDVHGNGNLMIFADGSVSDLKTIAGKASPASLPK